MISSIGHRPLAIGAAIAFAVVSATLGAQVPRTPSPAPKAESRAPVTELGSPVVLDADTLFYLYDGMAAYSSEERAERLSETLARLASQGASTADSIAVVSDDRRTEITLARETLLFVTDSDAAGAGMDRPEAAARYAQRIRTAIPVAAAIRSYSALWHDAVIASIETVVMILLLLLTNFLFPRIYQSLDRRRTGLTDFIAALGIHGLTADRVVDALLVVARFARIAVTLILLIAYLPMVLSIFPETAAFADRMIAAVLSPLRHAATAIVDYLPSVVIVIIIAFGARIVIRAVRGLFGALRSGAVTIQNFDPEWAMPTFQIVRAVLVALSFALMFPFLPGSNSEAIRAVSIFLGVLLSFGSSSAVSNLIAGLVLLYSRAFHVGDWVRIGSVEGAVIARALLVTRLRTPKNVEISVPNGVVLAGPIENFTAQAESGRLILHTTVTIGYDAPWRTVHELLTAAARATANIAADPAPFVLQTALGDYNVSYQINAYTRRAELQPAIYGELHRNIQEQFNAAGIEIMSPHFLAVRDGNSVTIPEAQRPPGYTAPTFRVSSDKE